MTDSITLEETRESNTDTLFIIGFSLFVLFLFIGEIVLLVYLTKHGYIDRFLDMIP